MATPTKARIRDRQLDLKYRPFDLSGVVGHAPVVRELGNVFKNAEKTLPAVIGFFGESGRGKTTFARIVTAYLNCAKGTACGKCESCKLVEDGNHPDLKEYNCADVGADEAVGIITAAQFKPRYKTRIIFLDEIHKIKSQQAMDKFLKPMEEPPLNTVWIIATNLPEKIPNSKAVIGRSMAFWLDAPAPDVISNRLLEIAKLEKATVVTKAMTDTLAHNCNGQVRNAIKSLERLINALDDHFANDRKAKRLGRIDKKALEGILSSITSAGVGEDAEVNALASELLLGLYLSDPGAVVTSIMSTKDHVKLVNAIMYLNQYLMASQFTQRCPGIWHSDTNKGFAAQVKKAVKGGMPANELGMFHKAITEMRAAVVSGGVPPEHHMLSACMSLMLAPE